MSVPPRSLALLLGLWLVVPPIAASETSAATGEETAWRRSERTLSFEHDADGFRYVSLRDATGHPDWVDADFSLDDATFRYSFVSTDPGNESFVRVYLAFGALIEFRDRDGDGTLGPGDEPLRRTMVEDRTQTEMAVRALPDGSYVTSARYALNGSADEGRLPLDPQDSMAGELTIHTFVTPRLAEKSGTPVGPADAHFEVVLAEYPFLEASTHVALEMSLRSSQVLRPEAGGLGAEGGPFEFFFHWSEQAAVGDSKRTVAVTVVDDSANGIPSESLTLFTFAYPRSRSIQHDPVLGVRKVATAAAMEEFLPAQLKGDPEPFLAGLAMAGLLVGAAAWVRLRRA